MINFMWKLDWPQGAQIVDQALFCVSVRVFFDDINI